MPKVPSKMVAQTRMLAAFLVFALVAQLFPVWQVQPAAAVDTSSVKLYYPDMHSRLGAKILASVSTVGAARLKVTATGPSGYNKVLADIPSPTTADAEVAKMDLRGLAAGTYTLTADVTNSSGTLIAQKVRTFNKPMSGTPRVGFDENNALIVNGAVTPVVGTWWGNYAGSWSPQYLPSLKQAGRVTTAEVIDGARSASTWASALDQSAANGVTAIGPTMAGQSDVAGIVNAAKGKSALLAHMFMDEPEYSGVAASTVRGWTNTAHANDPNHPVMVNLVGPMFVNQGGSQATARSFTYDYVNNEKDGVVDWYSSDYYPIAFSPNFGMSRQTAYDKFAEHLTNLRTWTKDLYPLHTFIEVASMPELNSTTAPKPNEVWAQVWIAVTQGVRSIAWFPVDSTGSAVTDPGIPAMETKATSYLTRYAPMLAQANSNKVTRTTVSGSGRVDFTAKEYNGKLYVFAVNRDVSSSASVKFNLSQFTGSAVSVYDENRTVALSSNSFTDTFAPYGVHIYEISGTGTTPAPNPTPEPTPTVPAPTGTMSINGGAASTTSTAVTVNSNVTGATEMRIDPGTGTFGGWTTYANSANVTLPAGDGTKTVRAEYRNAGGTTALSDTITLSTPVVVPAPTGTMSVNNGAASTADPGVTVNSSVSGATEMRIDPGTGTFGGWTTYASTASITLPAGDGTKTVRAEYRNAGGVLAIQDTITLATPVITGRPSGSVSINDGAATTISTAVTVNSKVRNATEMRVNSGFGYGAWMPYAATVNATIPSGTGTKIVRVEYRGPGGTLALMDAIKLSAASSVAVPTGWFTVNHGASATNTRTVSIDNYVTGATQMRFGTDGSWGSWMPYAASASYSMPSGDGTKTVNAQFSNSGGVWSQSTFIVLDTAAPTGWFTINNGAGSTYSNVLSIQNYITGATKMRFATGGSYGEWMTYAANTSLSVSTGAGTKYVSVQYADDAGNVHNQSTSIILR